MATNALRGYNTVATPQNEKAAPKQKKNAAGGYTFKVSDMEYVLRFLILGTEGGTYYTDQKKLTKDAAKHTIEMAKTRSRELVDLIVEVSTSGRAPKNDQAIFALAIASSFGSTEDKKYALSKLDQVCRTATHLFDFNSYVEQFRGRGRALNTAVGQWYLSKTPDSVAFQATKYRQRNGWTNADVLRLTKPVTHDPAMNATFRWITKGVVTEDAPRIIEGFTKAQEAGADLPKLIETYGLAWEHLPTEALNDPKVWAALLDKGMPPTALMRNLPKLTNLGLLPQMGGYTAQVSAALQDVEKLRKGRIHPVRVLLANRTYASGRSLRGSSTWTPTRGIIDALDAAFYNAYGAVEPANKRTLLALDVSGSMGIRSAGDLGITARDASAALALVQMATEPEVAVIGFTAGRGSSYSYGTRNAVTELNISPRQRLSDAIKEVSDLPFGGTDCALPMQYALGKKMPVDTFVIYTDNETWAGWQHPFQALEKYRREMGIDSKLIVVGITATDSTITNPDDPGSLDVVGFDASVPNLINDFSRGL